MEKKNHKKLNKSADPNSGYFLRKKLGEIGGGWGEIRGNTRLLIPYDVAQATGIGPIFTNSHEGSGFGDELGWGKWGLDANTLTHTNRLFVLGPIHLINGSCKEKTQ